MKICSFIVTKMICHFDQLSNINITNSLSLIMIFTFSYLKVESARTWNLPFYPDFDRQTKELSYVHKVC